MALVRSLQVWTLVQRLLVVQVMIRFLLMKRLQRLQIV